MRITFLGTGTSHGVPVIGCHCPVCSSVNPKDKRLRVSVLIEVDGQNLVIDTGPDFRLQMLTEKVERLDAVLLTHEHKDHTAGFDDVRAFNFYQEKPIDIYASPRVEANLRKSYDYIFSDFHYPGIPQIQIHSIGKDPFYIGKTKITPFEVMHLKLPVQAFRVYDFVYITDANKIPDAAFEKIKNAKVLVLNALRIEPHISHFSLSEAIETAQMLNAEKVYFIHMSHQMGLHDEVQKTLPENYFLAYDGLKIEL